MKEQLVKLLGLEAAGHISRGEIKEIPITIVSPSPYQPRKNFPADELRELAASIEKHGVLQPVIVRVSPKGYELVLGERRLRACKLAGKETIPAVVREISEQDMAVLGLVENVQRSDLNFLEEAESYRELIEKFSFTQEELALKVGKSQAAIANKIRLLKLPQRIREIISREMISERHARALLKLNQVEQQEYVIRLVKEDALNVIETEKIIDKLIQAGSTRPKSDKNRQRKTPIYKDIRIFFNTFRQAVQELKKIGYPAEIEEEDESEYYRITLRIPKKKEEATK